MPPRGSGGRHVAAVTVNVDGRMGRRIQFSEVDDGGFSSANGGASAMFSYASGTQHAHARAAAAAAAAVRLTTGVEGPGACSFEGGVYRVTVPDRDVRKVSVYVCCGALGADMQPEPSRPFTIQNLCGSQELLCGVDLRALRPVLSRRRGAMSGRHEVLTPAGTLTFRKNCACVDFKGARGIAALRPDLAAATRGPAVHAGPPRVYMAVLRGAVGHMLDLSDPDRNYVANMAEPWCEPRHGVDGLNEMPTLDLAEVDWDAMLAGGWCAASPLLGDLRAAKTRLKLSRRGWVLMYTIFPDGGVPWSEEAEASLLCVANAALRRLRDIASGRELPGPRAPLA